MPALDGDDVPQPDTPQEATGIVRRNLASGADLTKLFTGSWVQRGHVLPMPVNIAKAAVTESHLNGKLVFAHPSNLAGIQVAIDSGVDVLAHAADDTNGVDAKLLSSAIAKNMAMIPTLKMFTTTVTTDPHYMDPICAEVQQFHQLGGTLLFGTDVGYMADYSTEGEFVELGKSGLDWKTVLAMLTTNPAVAHGRLRQQRRRDARQTRRPHDPRRRSRRRPHKFLPRARRRALGQGGLAALESPGKCPIHRSFIAMSGFGPMSYTDELRFQRLPACRKSCFSEDLALSRNPKSAAADHRRIRSTTVICVRRNGDGGDGRRRAGHDE